MNSKNSIVQQRLNEAKAESMLKQMDILLEKMEAYAGRVDSEDNISTPHDAELILKFRKLRGTAEHLQFRLSQIRDNAKRQKK